MIIKYSETKIEKVYENADEAIEKAEEEANIIEEKVEGEVAEKKEEK